MIKVKCKFIFEDCRFSEDFSIKLKIYLNNRVFPISIKETLVSTWWDDYRGKDNYGKIIGW